MNFDKIFEVIDHLYESRKQDEILMELVSDFYKYAIEYTEYRVKWNFYSMEERQVNDGYRTSKHNAFIDSYNILVRYLGKSMEVSELQIEGDRKVYGDFANYVVYKLAVKQR